MSKTQIHKYRTFKTPEGVKVSTYQVEGKNPSFHSLDGPAIKYPKSMKRPDEYFIYGIPYTKEKWLELKNDVKVIHNPFNSDSI